MPRKENNDDVDQGKGDSGGGKEAGSGGGGGASTATAKPKGTTKRSPKKKPPGMLPPWKVLLHNDDKNEMGFVVGTIVELTPLNRQDAELRTKEADETGVALLLVIGVPLIAFALLAATFSNAVIRDLRVDVVDQDQSQTSMTFVQAIGSAPGVSVSARSSDLNGAMHAIRSGEAIAAVAPAETKPAAPAAAEAPAAPAPAAPATVAAAPAEHAPAAAAAPAPRIWGATRSALS